MLIYSMSSISKAALAFCIDGYFYELSPDCDSSPQLHGALKRLSAFFEFLANSFTVLVKFSVMTGSCFQKKNSQSPLHTTCPAPNGRKTQSATRL